MRASLEKKKFSRIASSTIEWSQKSGTSLHEVRGAVLLACAAKLSGLPYRQISLLSSLSNCAFDNPVLAQQITSLSYDGGNDIGILGWVYQKLRGNERSDLTIAIPRRGDVLLSNSDEIARVTQTFTDGYIAHALVEQCLGASEDTASSDFSLCDPACGSGNFLEAAFDFLLARNTTASLKERAEFILQFQLFGLDIDSEVVEVARLSLLARAVRAGMEPARAYAYLLENIQCVPFREGSLLRQKGTAQWQQLLAKQYSAVVTNPPYLARRKMVPGLREFLDTQYSSAANDLFSAFVERSFELVKPQGTVGLLTVNRWLFAKSFSKLRGSENNARGIFNRFTLIQIAELGANALEKRQPLHDSVQFAALVLKNEAPQVDHTFAYSDMRTASFEHKQKLFPQFSPLENSVLHIPQIALRSKQPAEALRMNGEKNWIALQRRLGTSSQIVVGLQTNNDSRHVRYFWEVPHGAPDWCVHHKGGGAGRWYGQKYWMLSCAEDFNEYKRSGRNPKTLWSHINSPGWCYSWLAAGTIAIRKKDAHESFGRAASGGVFLHDLRFAAILNSPVSSYFVHMLTSKAQVPEGVIAKLPLATDLSPIQTELIELAVELKKQICEYEIIEPVFTFFSLMKFSERIKLEALLRIVENSLHHQVLDAMKLTSRQLRSFTLVYPSVARLPPPNCQDEIINALEPWKLSDTSIKRLIEDNNKPIVIDCGVNSEKHCTSFSKLVAYLFSRASSEEHPWRTYKALGDESDVMRAAWMQDILSALVIDSFGGIKGDKKSRRFGVLSEQSALIEKDLAAASCNFTTEQVEGSLKMSFAQWFQTNFFKRHSAVFRGHPLLWNLKLKELKKDGDVSGCLSYHGVSPLLGETLVDRLKLSKNNQIVQSCSTLLDVQKCGEQGDVPGIKAVRADVERTLGVTS